MFLKYAHPRAHESRPQMPVQTSDLHRLRHMLRADFLRAIQVYKRPGESIGGLRTSSMILP